MGCRDSREIQRQKGGNRENMRQVILDEAVEVNKLVMEKGEQGFIGFGSYGVQMRASDFLEIFQEYTVEKRDCEEYPWELTTVYNGETFFALIDERRVAEYDIQIPKEDL